MMSLHFLRPYYFLLFLPWVFIFVWLFRKKGTSSNLLKLCDAHLLKELTTTSLKTKRGILFSTFMSGFFMIVALAGPYQNHADLPLFHAKEPMAIALSLADDMMLTDLHPNRLTRIKFKLNDWFKTSFRGEVGLLLFTDEAFVASPLTEDGNTLSALLPEITSTVMPTHGNDPKKALEEASNMIKSAGYMYGKILLITSTVPDEKLLNKARLLQKEGFETSVLPVIADEQAMPFFAPLKDAGGGLLLSFKDPNALEKFASRRFHETLEEKNARFAGFNDKGAFFIFFALLFILPLAQRGALRGVR